LEDKTNNKVRIKRRLQTAQRCLTILFLVCVAYLAWYRWDCLRAQQKSDQLRAIAGQPLLYAEEQDTTTETAETEATQEESRAEDAVNAGNTLVEQEPDTAADEAEEEERREELFAEGYAVLSAINPDLKGWLSIPDTTLSYPVVQGEDNSYYLRRDFFGESDRRGTLFMDCAADFEGGARNLIIYGHNMSDGSMFASLKKYQDEAYYKEHPSFYITLPEEIREYRIISVFKNDLFSRADEPFQFYDYNVIDSEEQFKEYYQNIKGRSLYDTGVEAGYPDELITLCTCDYSGRDARLLVVGKRIR